MDVELAEIRDFLAGVPPFDTLPPEVLDGVPRALTIRYVRRGRAFPPEDVPEPYLYVVRQGAIELRTAKDELAAKYGEGDLHEASCRAMPESAGLRGLAVEDTLVYCLPCRALEALRGAHPEFEAHFARTLRERLRRTLDALQSSPALGGGLMTIDVGSLVARPPVHVGPDASIQDAARAMTRERISSLVVLEGGRLAGIVTDRDLRGRAVAEAVSPDRPVRDIMTSDVHVIAPDAPAFEALLQMTRLGIHHLPVARAGEVLGVVTTTDLVRYQSANTVYLGSAVRRAGSVPALQQIAARLPELQIQMVAAGATPRHVGLAIGAVIDALTTRLLAMGEAELGPAPVPYAWLAFGSQARHEQTVHSDQDNGLLVDDAYDPAAHGGWFEGLARFVTDGLAACGFPFCPGDVMARNPTWRRSLAGWRAHFDGWIDRPEPKALMNASIFFDLRAAAGEARLAEVLAAHVRGRVRGNEPFVARLVANAVQQRPPLGFFRDLVVDSGGEHAETLDLKKGGTMPVVELARVYALLVGAPATATLDRLRAGAEGGAVSREGSDDLAHAFRLFCTLRQRHQADQLKRGLPTDNRVRPKDLSPLERGELRDAFAAVRRHQDQLAQVWRARWIL